MNYNTSLGRGLVIGIIVMFIITSVVSVTSTTIRDKDFNSNLCLPPTFFGFQEDKSQFVDHTCLPLSYDRNFSEIGYSVFQTIDDGYVIVGSTSLFDGEEYQYHVLVIKTDSGGEIEWKKTYAGLGIASSLSGTQTNDNGFIITGVTIHEDDLNTPLILLLKIDSEGNQQWQKSFLVGEGGYGYYIQNTPDGGYVITGVTKTNDIDVLLIKTDEEGNMEWNTSVDVDYYDLGISVVVCDDGYIIAGYTMTYKGLIVKINNSGYEEWNKTYSFGNYSALSSIVKTQDNGFMATGIVATYNETSSTQSVLLLKIDADGNEEWNKTVGENYSSGASIQRTDDNGYVITGSRVTPSSDPEEDVYFDQDVLLIKTDDEGNEEWNKTFHFQDYDVGTSVKQTSDGGYIITGFTMSFFSGSWNEDVILIKTDGNGNEEWNKTFGWAWHDTINPTVKITKPTTGFYKRNEKKRELSRTIILHNIDIEVNASDNYTGIDRVDFYIDGKLLANDTSEPYTYNWERPKVRLRFFKHRHTIEVVAYDNSGNSASNEITVWRFF